MVTIKERVRFVETDTMGVVHHANYFHWFEMGRVAYLRAAGVSLNDLMAAGIVFPITDISAKYLTPGRFDDNIEIRTTLEILTRVKLCFSYEVVRTTDGTVLATGNSQNVFTNPQGKIIRLSDEFFAKIDGLYRQEKRNN